MNVFPSNRAKPEHLNKSEDAKTAEPDSQSKPDATLEELKAKIVEDQCKRYIIQKTAIGKDYNISVYDMEHAINTLFSTAASCSAHQAQLQRLQQLLAQKTSIEARMARQLANLKAAYDAHSHDLDMVVQRYAKEMN